MNTETLEHDPIHSNVRNQKHWLRLVYMLLFAVMLHLASLVMWVVCSLQFLFVLTTGEDNANLRALAKSLASYIQQALNFVSYNSEHKPFPFASWPDEAEQTPAPQSSVQDPGL